MRGKDIRFVGKGKKEWGAGRRNRVSERGWKKDKVVWRGGGRESVRKR